MDAIYSDLQGRLRRHPRQWSTPPEGNGLAYDFTLNPLQDLEVLGGMPQVSSLDIPASPLGIGFETLDRDTFDPESVYPFLKCSGVKHARCQTGWIKCEPTVGQYDFRWLDKIVDGLRAIGIQPWLSLGFGHPAYTPCEAYDQAWRENGGRPPKWGFARGYVAQVPLYYGEKGMRGWLDYVTALVTHFRGRVSEYEVWNEPEGFWQHNGRHVLEEGKDLRTIARDYAELVRRTAAAVRAVQSEAKIIADFSHTATGYIAELGRLKLGEVIDVAAYHFYGFAPEFMLRERIGHLRANLQLPGRALEIWQGESGCWITRPCPQTEFVQAKYLCRRYLSDLKEGVAMSSFFTVTDFLNYYADGGDQHYGVIDARRQRPKLAFHAMQTMAYLCDGFAMAPDLAAVFTPRNRYWNGSLLPYRVASAAFRRKGIPVYALWTPESVDIQAPVVDGVIQVISAEDEFLGHPVVIDPIRSKVAILPRESPVGFDFLSITDVGLSEYLNAQRFLKLPVMDYPLFISDAALFDDLR
jgi:hypothetical protein